MMRSTRRAAQLSILTLGAASMALTLAACSGGASSDATKAPVTKVTYAAGTPLEKSAAGTCTSDGKSDAQQTIAYIPPSSIYNYYLAIGKGIQARAEGAGAKYFMLAPPTDDTSTQLGMIQDAATRGATAIILNTEDQTAAAPVVKAAADKGIAIILVNSDIPNYPTPVQAVVGYKQFTGDTAVGEYAVKEAAGKPAKYGIIDGLPGYFTDQRVGGFEAGIKGASNFTKVADVNGQWTIDGGNAAALDLLQAHPEINTIFAANDYMAQGTAQALKALNRTDVVVYGSDGDTNSGLEQVSSGAVKATLNTAPFQMGQIAMQVALDCMSGKIPGGTFVESPASVVDKSTVNALLCKPALLYPLPSKKYNCS